MCATMDSSHLSTVAMSSLSLWLLVSFPKGLCTCCTLGPCFKMGRMNTSSTGTQVIFIWALYTKWVYEVLMSANAYTLEFITFKHQLAYLNLGLKWIVFLIRIWIFFSDNYQILAYVSIYHNEPDKVLWCL